MIEPITKIFLFIIIHKTILSYKSKLWIPKIKPNKREDNSFSRMLSSISVKTVLQLKLNNNENENTNEKSTTNTETSSHPKTTTNKEQCVVIVKDNKTFCKSKLNLYLYQNDFFENKELITISPGGFKGFYLLGILSYIKEHYDTERFIYSGASAGSWNSLFMCYNGNPKEFIYDLLDGIILNTKSIIELQYFMKYKILANYSTSDFDVKRLFIGVSKINGLALSSHIFTEFKSLEDAIDCCMASSHIPLITGGLTNKYNNMFSLDGGLSDYPYLDMKSKLHVYPNMWKHAHVISNIQDKPPEGFFTKIAKSILQFSEFFSVKKNNPLKLFDDGYQDAKMNRDYLDSIFLSSSSKPFLEEDASQIIQNEIDYLLEREEINEVETTDNGIEI